MAEDAEDDPTYLDEVVEETPMLFASSETVLTIEDPNLHPMGKATAIFLLFTCMMGSSTGWISLPPMTVLFVRMSLSTGWPSWLPTTPLHSVGRSDEAGQP